MGAAWAIIEDYYGLTTGKEETVMNIGSAYDPGKHMVDCPGEDEPRIVIDCDYCGKSIREGDDYYDVDGNIYCEDCFETMARDSRKTAYFEEDYDK